MAATRMIGWRQMKDVMEAVDIHGSHASSMGLRQGFGVAAVTAGIPLSLVQKWLGHAKIQTTAIYTDAMGAKEHEIARRM